MNNDRPSKHCLNACVVCALLAWSAGAVAAPEKPATASAWASDYDERPVVLPTPTAMPADQLATASAEIKRVARWVVDSDDNRGMPFLLIDKVNAQVFAFNAIGQLKASAPALLGMARGDQLLASNETTVAAIRPEERVTPAGRYISRLARDSDGKELLVIDYAAAISLHPVIPGTPAERRAERLGSATPDDNRISKGCINVPVEFYETYVSPTFSKTKGVVYILPENGSAAEFFGMQPVGGATVADRDAASAP